MKKKISFIVTLILLFCTILFTILVKFVDVKAIGPMGSKVGFSSLNGGFRDLMGFNDTLYDISKYLGFLSFAFLGFYVVLGIIELVKSKNLKKVHREIYFLLINYFLTLLLYVTFEKVIVNYRPILENGVLEASYPSSHTLLVISICGTGMMANYFLNKKDGVLSNNIVYSILQISELLVLCIVIISRLFSGVHWFTDIIGGLLFGGCLVSLYWTINNFFIKINQ